MDVLTNMHANETVPEVHGCARAYEVTGDERYLNIVKAYWKQAVTDRGTFATGGQTAGEIWTPIHTQSRRLNHNNQEHCVVYNMIRLADYLYRQTGEKEYLDYIERNLINGLYSQAFWKDTYDSLTNAISKEEGIVTYYQPLEAGSHKKWGSRTEDFWCCHCTAVQGPSRYREWIWYHGKEDTFTLAQFVPSRLETTAQGKPVALELTVTDRGGEGGKLPGWAPSIRRGRTTTATLCVCTCRRGRLPSRFGCVCPAGWPARPRSCSMAKRWISQKRTDMRY